ncbi:MAG: peptidase M14 [Winogradskyella sp.]|uniref:M14 family metallopeptidase n=1 Tax=Winogradskyella sp. TaxID=1883156 RepID=UPI0025F02658|nr:M14 metallopeptidase family protein [Winogradskyella sp.]NRB58904.1 peptidase M14 [Winogradskyella sp.]
MNLNNINSLYSLLKTSELFGRYITNSDIERCLSKIPKSMYSVIGYSVENRPIYALKFGTGSKKVLLWSQMHGNESTTTKALFDCFNLFETTNKLPNKILSECTLFIIPILNPDGAQRYTRLNANLIDLNRDAQDLSQPESLVLRQVYDDFKPDYCFNLHGQRTIYNVGNTNVSSSVSFLAPSQDAERSLTANRKVAMEIITDINKVLQNEIPNGVARYDDGFNLNCVGDTFQNYGVPTVLFEAGHCTNDYDREDVRRLMFISILKGLKSISDGVSGDNYQSYYDIPENSKQFYDVIIRKARENENSSLADIAIQFKERLVNGNIDFIPKIESISKLDNFFGHKEIDAKGNIVSNSKNEALKVTNEIDFVLINNEKLLLKP